MTYLSLTAVMLVSLALLPKFALSASHPFSVHDMVAMERIGDPQVSPDGSWVVFTKDAVEREKNKRISDLWIVDSQGQRLRRLTSHAAGSSHPRWSPDGKSIYFLASRTEISQLWRLPFDGGEAEQVTNFPLNVNGFIVSHDGKHIALAMEVFPNTTPAETKTRLDEQTKRKATGRIYDRLFVRHWDKWKDGRRSHIFVYPIAGGESVDIMKSMDADSPSKPFGGSEEFTFAPDGKSVVFVARDVGREEAWSTNLDLYIAPIDASEKPRCLTEPNRALDTQPIFSPDGKTLAYLAMTKPQYESDRQRIMLRAWPNGEPRELAETWDRSASSIAWSPDGKKVFVIAEELGQKPLFAIDVATGNVRTLAREGTVSGMSVGPERLVFGVDHLRSPVELFSVTFDGTSTKTLTAINAEKLALARMGEAEQSSFTGWNDEEVFVYIVKPVDFDPSKKYPVAFLIHGGPQGSFGNHFHYRWNPQAYAGAGYAAVMVDFHGSTGYGQAFTDSIRKDWGGKPLLDLQKGLAASLERYKWMDGDRVAALGASYGGYMINWIAGSWPDRFRCLVCHDGNLDERMAYYDTEELWFPEWDQDGTPWEKPDHYTKHNPINLVDKWRTPMLVIHGELDFRVVSTQGLSTFTALQRRGIPSKLLIFPDENHWVLKPANSILWHETVIAWLDQWTKK